MQKVLNDNQIQHQLYEQATQQILICAKKRLENDPKDMQQRFNSLSHEHAGKFLFAAPVIPPLELSDEAFRLAVKRRILMELFDNNRQVRCDCKKLVGIDPHGDHLFTCCKNTEFMMIRHDTIVRCLSQLASEARISHVVEPRTTFHDTTDKRPDIVLYNSHVHQGETIAIDVSVAHPVSGHLGASAGSALRKRDQEKQRKYAKLCENEKMQFQGFIFETYGSFSKNVDKFIKVCCAEIANAKGQLYSVLKHQWVTRLSATLQRCNSYFLTNCYRRLLKIEDSESELLYNSYYHRR